MNRNVVIEIDGKLYEVDTKHVVVGVMDLVNDLEYRYDKQSNEVKDCLDYIITYLKDEALDEVISLEVE